MVPARPGSHPAARKKFYNTLGAGLGLSEKLEMSLGDMRCLASQRLPPNTKKTAKTAEKTKMSRNAESRHGRAGKRARTPPRRIKAGKRFDLGIRFQNVKQGQFPDSAQFAWRGRAWRPAVARLGFRLGIAEHWTSARLPKSQVRGLAGGFRA